MKPPLSAFAASVLLVSSCAHPRAGNPVQKLSAAQVGVPASANQWGYQCAGRGGVRLHGRKWLAAGRPRAVVVAFHGLSGHAGNYAEVGPLLVRAGVSLYVPDRWSSGLNRCLPDGRTSAAGDIGRKSDWLADAESALLQVLKDEERAGHGSAIRRGDIPLLIYANSWGAKLAPSLLDLKRRNRVDSQETKDALAMVDGLYLSTPGLWSQKDGMLPSLIQRLGGVLLPHAALRLDVTKDSCCLSAEKNPEPLSHGRYTFRFLSCSLALTRESRATLLSPDRLKIPIHLTLADDTADIGRNKKTDGWHEHLMDNARTLSELDAAGLIHMDPPRGWSRPASRCHFMEQKHPRTVASGLLAFIATLPDQTAP